MYQVNRLKGKCFKTDNLAYAISRYSIDQNISLVQNLDNGEVIVQRIKDREKLVSMQCSWKAIQNS